MIPNGGRSLQSRVSSTALALLMATLIVLAACGGPDSDTTLATDTFGPNGGFGGGSTDESVLEVIGPAVTEMFTLDAIKAMPSTEGFGGTKSSTGRITPPVLVKGVLLDELFAAAGGLPEDMAVSIAAKDGYEMTLSTVQLRSGDFITYDMVTGEENEVEGPLTVILAYEYDGSPIDPESEGPLRLAIVSPEMNQVTDGHWWVKWVTRVELKPIEGEWTVVLSGRLTEEMDRATFETGAAEGCHGSTWTDADGNSWTGIPLYLLVGRVDDENVHEGPAYNRDLAQAGYQVQIENVDDGSVKVASTAMYYNDDLLVAHVLNGEALPDEYWPLRLVGEGVDQTEMIGQIVRIRALLPEQ